MSQKQIQKLKKQADILWSQAVRTRDGFECRVRGCGNSPAFAHHIFSRRHLATRWLLDNGFTICWGHHKKGHVDSEWLRDEIIFGIGQKKFNEMKKTAARITDHLSEEDLRETIEGLKTFIND